MAVASMLDEASSLCGPATWRGPAADRFRTRLHRHRARLRELAAELQRSEAGP